MKQPAALFLFNLTDVAPRPWLGLANGITCIAVDIQHTAPWSNPEPHYYTTNAPAGSDKLAALLELPHIALRFRCALSGSL